MHAPPRAARALLSRALPPRPQDADEFVRLSTYVTELRKRHDEMFQLAGRKELALRARVDSVKDLELDSVKLSEGDTPVTQHLRMLEGRMQASQQRYDDTLAQRKTFEQIAKRLRDERVGLQNQLASLERNLAAKTADLEELVRVSHDAAHAKEAAKAELAQVEDQLSNECAKREKEMADRQALWRIKQELAAAAEAAHAKAGANPKASEQEEPARRTSATSVFTDGGRTSDVVRRLRARARGCCRQRSRQPGLYPPTLPRARAPCRSRRRCARSRRRRACPRLTT